MYTKKTGVHITKQGSRASCLTQTVFTAFIKGMQLYNWHDPTSKISSPFLLAPTSFKVLLERGSGKPFSECLGLNNVIPSTALAQLWLFIGLSRPFRMPFPFLLARETMMQRSRRLRQFSEQLWEPLYFADGTSETLALYLRMFNNKQAKTLSLILLKPIDPALPQSLTGVLH